jgi:hypothetical protein
MTLLQVPVQWLVVAGVALLLVVVSAFYGFRALRSFRGRRAVETALAAVSVEFLTDVLLPDGNEGAVHVDALLKTANAIVVLDLRDISGLIFGSEQMTEWAVMQKNWRFTFSNPLGPLHDRLATVRAITGDQVTVDGRVVFTDRGSFPKGYPPLVTRLSSLPAALAGITELSTGLDEAWGRVCAVASKSPIPRRY